MATPTREIFAKVKSILGVTSLCNTSTAISLNYADVTLYCVSGNIWLNPNATAVADTTAFKLVAGDSIDFLCDSSFNIISDASGATYQYIVWKA